MIKYISWDREQEDELLDLWNQEIGEDFPMRKDLFVQNSFQDENVCLEASLIAVNQENNVVGFILAKRWQEEIKVNMSEDTGWIQVLLVRKQERNKGIGSALLAHAEARLKAKGMKQILLGRDPYHYFPGVPTIYPAVAAWFDKKGYVHYENEVDLTNAYDEEEAVEVPRPNNAVFSLLELKDKEAFLDFMRRCFPGRWEYEAVHYFAKGGTGREFVVLKKEGKIIGFCRINDIDSPMIAQNVYWDPLFDTSLGGVGPLGVDANERKQGFGISIVEAAIAFLRKRDIENIVIDWTGLIAFYEKLGFNVWKEYYAYKKEC